MVGLFENEIVLFWKNGRKLALELPFKFNNHKRNIDIKITNYCNAACHFCHESSTTNGKHGNILQYKFKRGTELAIGGGNPLSHPNLYEFLTNMKVSGVVCNITMNQLHVDGRLGGLKYNNMLRQYHKEGLISGVGLSMMSAPNTVVKNFVESVPTIFHTILGLTNPNLIINELLPIGKTLILGYKDFGFGSFTSETHMANIQNKQVKTAYKLFSHPLKGILLFDTLSYHQLKLNQNNSIYYWGNEGAYIDAVLGKGYRTSYVERKKENETNISQYLKQGIL